jgi:hypothetical protein
MVALRDGFHAWKRVVIGHLHWRRFHEFMDALLVL